MVEQTDFLKTVQKIWKIEVQGSPMYTFWRKLKKFQPIVRGLNRRSTKEVKKINEYINQLTRAQIKLNTNLFNTEAVHEVKLITEKLMQATEDEEKILRQKSKAY